MKKGILESMLERKKIREKEEEKCQKKFDSLSLEERNAYEQIVDRQRTEIIIPVVSILFKFIIYLGVFGLICFFLFEIDIAIPILNIVQSLFKLLPLIIVLCILSEIINSSRINKLKRKLLFK